MQGLGDAFAARPTVAALVREHGDVFLETAWPEVFRDICAPPVKPRDLHIRCARRNVEEKGDIWSDPPHGIPEVQLRYTLAPGCKSIPEQIAESAGIEWTNSYRPEDPKAYAGDFFMDCNQKSMNVRNRLDPSPLAVFRIPTIRTEYRNEARNPAPGLVAAAVNEIGGDWIHLNDMMGLHEKRHHDESWPMANYAHADAGQLSLPSMLDLVSRARCVVTPVSWMLWAAAAFQVPTLAVWGG